MINNLYKKISESKKLDIIKAIFYYFFSFGIVKFASFLTTPIFTRFMSKSEYGMVNNFTAWQVLIAPIMSLGLKTAVRRSGYLYKEDNDSFLRYIIIVSDIFALLAWGIIELNSDFFVGLFGMEMPYIRGIIIYNFFHVITECQLIQYNVFHKSRQYFILSLTETLGCSILSVILVIIMSRKADARIIGMLVPIIIINLVVFTRIARRGHGFKLEYIPYSFSTALPLLVSELSGQVLSSSDRVMITRYCGNESTAIYSLGYAISGLAAALWTVLNQIWMPWYMDHLHAGDVKPVKRAATLFSLFYCGVVVFLMLVTPEVVLILGGQAYEDAMYITGPLYLASACQFFYGLYYNTEYFYGETYVISIGTMIAAFLNYFLNLIFIPQYGYKAAAYTTLIGYACMLAYHYFIVKFKLKKEKQFNNAYFLLMLAALALMSYVMEKIVNLMMLRYCIIVAYTFVLAVFAYKYLAKEFGFKVNRDKL